MKRLIHGKKDEKVFYAQDADDKHVYAFVSEWGYPEVLVSDIKSMYRWLICDGVGRDQVITRGVTEPDSFHDIQSALAVRTNQELVYEFDSFFEFCQWVVGVEDKQDTILEG